MLVRYILGTCILLTTSIFHSVISATEKEEEDAYYPVSTWSDTFDWKLLKEFSAENRNVLVSPISLKLVLGLLYQGSSGTTEREFQTVLQFTDKKAVAEQYQKVLNALQASEREEYVLNIGSRVFLDTEIKPKQMFASIAKDSFKTDIELVNFTSPIDASRSINSWIEKLTNGRISRIVKPDELSKTIMIVTNAVYFKGTWKNRFPRENSFADKFYVANGEDILSITVPYMKTKEKFFYVESPNFDAKILRLPYKGRRYSMFIVLPNSKGGLPMVLKKLNLHSLKSLLYLMDTRVVEVTIPKFKFDFQARLTQIMRNFGLHQMFQNTASFPGIARGNNTLLRLLVVSDIIQKSGIEVDEEGSVVYAATEINIGNKIGEAEAVFEATHPFLFFIEEEVTGTILFCGKVENPLEEDPTPLQPKIDD